MRGAIQESGYSLEPLQILVGKIADLGPRYRVIGEKLMEVTERGYQAVVHEGQEVFVKIISVAD